MEDWMFGPPLLIGDRVLYRSDSGTLLNGTVRWLGRLSAEFGQQMVVGVELVRTNKHRRYLQKPSNISTNMASVLDAINVAHRMRLYFSCNNYLFKKRDGTYSQIFKQLFNYTRDLAYFETEEAIWNSGCS